MFTFLDPKSSQICHIYSYCPHFEDSPHQPTVFPDEESWSLLGLSLLIAVFRVSLDRQHPATHCPVVLHPRLLYPIPRSIAQDTGLSISLPLSQKEYDMLDPARKAIVDDAQALLQSINVQILSVLLQAIGLSFHLFESACRVSCSLACQEFAQKAAKCQTAHHEDVWKTLKRLSGLERTSIACTTCSIDHTRFVRKKGTELMCCTLA